MGMEFPGRIIAMGEADKETVRAIAAALTVKGYAVTSPDGVYDRTLRSLVKLFQSQNVDLLGRPLEADGKVGSLSWGALFGGRSINAVPTGAAGLALGVAVSQIGVMEEPTGSNRGEMVDLYQRKVGLSLTPGKPGHFWCMAFVYWCFLEAGGGSTPFPKTAGCIDAWNKVRAKDPSRLLTRTQALADPARVKPGMVFILDHGGGKGHTGFVRQSLTGALKTVEGNTNPAGSANGLGVFELNRRKVIDPSLKGFIDFT